MATVDAATAMARSAELARLSEEAGRLTRPSCTPAMADANALVADWMRAASMTVAVDAMGTLRGRYPGTDSSAGVLLLGSHLDTVRDAGAYDGVLGVLAGLACVERLAAVGRRLPFAVEVVALADEEGLRFGTAYFGSRALSGTFPLELLELTDDAGTTLAEALRAFGGDPAPEAIAGAALTGERVLGFCEAHIEQGPVLDDAGLALGVVSAIAGATRASVTFTGAPGHAGTVPMAGRRDAVCGAAEWILAVEALGGASPGLIATTGDLAVRPGASNVIAGAVRVSLDVRHGDDDVRLGAVAAMREAAHVIAHRRDLRVDWQPRLETAAVATDPALTERLRAAAAEAGHDAVSLTSGAGHDAAVLADLAPVAMLFVRCAEGVSHSPAESVAAEDVAAALDALEGFVVALAADRSWLAAA